MISPAIHFNGRCKEAIKLYEQAFEVTEKSIEYYHDAPPEPGFNVTEDMSDLVMHASITFCGSTINLSDTEDKVNAGNMICLNVFFQTADEVCHAYEKLKVEGKVIVELGPQFFSPMYGSVEDKFGIKWQLISPL